jgi:microcystin-dependent protein
VPTPYLGEVRTFAGDFAPAGWSACDGTELDIAGNEDLYAVLGDVYGGDGEATFALPDLRGRAPLHKGQGPATSAYSRGDTGGVERATLTDQEIPPHAHSFQAAPTQGTGNQPWSGYVVAASATVDVFAEREVNTDFAATAVAPAGSSRAHENRMPFVAVNYVMATGPEATSGDGPFVGEVRPLAGDVVPAGWARCEGQLLPVEQNPVLFSVVSTLYGGDGEAEFALPDLRGGVVIGSGQGDGTDEYPQGTAGGAAAVALEVDDLPAHAHRARANTWRADVQTPGPDRSFARSGSGVAYRSNPAGSSTELAPETLAATGSGAPHDNYQPVLTLNFVIALEGEIPSR